MDLEAIPTGERQYEPRHADHPVDLYEDFSAAPPHSAVIGRIEGRGNMYADDADVQRALPKHVRSLGGDAAVYGTVEVPLGSIFFFPVSGPRFTAFVLRYAGESSKSEP
jgi:hypothetical protein